MNIYKNLFLLFLLSPLNLVAGDALEAIVCCPCYCAMAMASCMDWCSKTPAQRQQEAQREALIARQNRQLPQVTTNCGGIVVTNTAEARGNSIEVDNMHDQDALFVQDQRVVGKEIDLLAARKTACVRKRDGNGILLRHYAMGETRIIDIRQIVNVPAGDRRLEVFAAGKLVYPPADKQPQQDTMTR